MWRRLLRVAGALAFVAVGLLLVAGCGESRSSQIADYLRQVDAAQNKLAGAMHQVSVANEAFAKGGGRSVSHTGALLQAQDTLVQLRGQVAAIPTPPDAKHLRALLLELLDREVALSKELRTLAIFLPSFDADLHPLVRADATLKGELGKSTSGKAASVALDAAKARALEAYAATSDGVIARLRRLDPPPVWKPAYTSQLSELEQLSRSASQLGAAIAAGRAAAVPPLLRRFDAAAAVDRSVANQKAQIAAVDAYDREIRSLDTIARRIEVERVHLQNSTD